MTVWDLATATALTSVQGHTAQVRDIACSPDGRLAVSGGNDCAVQLWDLGTGKVQATLGRLESPVLSVAFTPDGTRAAASDSKGWVMIWDCRTRQCVRKIDVMFGDKIRARHLVHDIAFSPDGRRLATVGEDGCARIWDTRTGFQLRGIEVGEHEEAMAVTFSIDGKTLITGSFDGWVATWNADSGRNLSGSLAHAGPLTAVECSPDGATVLSASWDRTVRLWKASGMTPQSVIAAPSVQTGIGGESLARDVSLKSVIAGAGAEVTAASFSPDGSMVLTAAGAVRIWAAAGDPDNVLDGTGWLRSVDITPDGRRVVANNEHSGGGVWDVSSRRLERRFSRKGVSAVAMAPDGAAIATADATGISIEDLQNGRERTRFKLAQGTGDCLAYSPDGALIVTGSCAQPGVRLLDAATGDEKHLLADAVGPFAFAGDGTRLVTGGDPGGARVWDSRSGKVVCTLPRQATMSIAFSPDGRLIMGCGTRPVGGCEPTRDERSTEENLVRLWDATTGREVRTFAGHTQVVSSVAFFPDSRRAATGGADMLVRVWEVDTGRELLQLQGHTHHVNGVAVSRDGRTIASASFDHTARAWEAWDWSMTPAQVTDLKLARFREFRAARAAPRPR